MSFNRQYSNPFENFKSGLMLPGQLKQEEKRAPNYGTLAQSEADLAKLAPQEKMQKLAQIKQQMEINPRIWESEIGQRNAQTNKMNTMTPLEARKAELENKMYPELTKAQINHYNKMSTAGLGTGGNEELLFQDFVAKDNPHLKDPRQIYEAANVLREGGDQLSDGTKLNPLSPASRMSFDRLIKGTTTSGAMTPLINANQAEAEINELSKFAQEGLKPYGTTYFNKSPDQIMDSFKSDEKSQKKLGKFIASQQLQYEIAQNEIKLAMGQPGVTSTQELMALGHQMINTNYPKLSYTARQEANRYFMEALKRGLEARKKKGISISNALKNNNANESSESFNNDPLGIR